MKGKTLPGIANHYHWVFGLSPRYVFRSLEVLLFLPGSPVICAQWLGAPLWLCPGAAQGGSRGDV